MANVITIHVCKVFQTFPITHYAIFLYAESKLENYWKRDLLRGWSRDCTFANRLINR